MATVAAVAGGSKKAPSPAEFMPRGLLDEHEAPRQLGVADLREALTNAR